MRDNLKIFSGSSNSTLAEEICDCLDIPLSRMEISRFSNDNLSIQICENVRERDVFVVQSFSQPVSDNIVKLLIILDALRSASARRITTVIPYYSYARSDKKDAPRISITGRLMADLLQTAGANRVLTMDLHAGQVHGFFSIPVDHLTAIPIIANHVKLHFDRTSLVAVAADAGGATRAGRFAQYVDIPLAIIDKRRISDTEVKQGHVVGDVENKDVIIFEDEISTGTTLLSTEETLKNAGANHIFAGAIHPVLCGPAMENLDKSNIQQFIVTNTVEVPPEKRVEKIAVLSVAPLFAEAIRRIHTGESVGALFD